MTTNVLQKDEQYKIFQVGSHYVAINDSATRIATSLPKDQNLGKEDFRRRRS